MRAVLLILFTACAPRYVPCNDTISCREQALRRDAEFARAVAREPAAMRLDVEPISRVVLVDRRAGLVYALDPELVALDLETGVERWRAGNVRGDSLWRAGRYLAVTNERATLPPTVWFLDPSEGRIEPTDCKLALDPPKEADRVQLHLFDRAAQPYAYWVSGWTYEGGTPPDEASKARERNATACGVVKLDPRTCELHSESLGEFTWDPPEGRPRPCALSPLRDLPAAAASAPKVDSASALLLVGPHRIALRVTLARTTTDCTQIENVTLEAHDPTGELLWKHALADRTRDVCGKP